MYRYFTMTGLSLLALSAYAASPENAAAPATPNLSKPAAAAATSGSAASDRSFVEQAGVAGITEIEASKLALKQSTNARVQGYARQMIAEHARLAEQLASAAMQAGIAAPQSLPDAVTMQKLATLQGSDFDLYYVQDVAVLAHQNAVTLFSQEAESGNSAALKQLAQNALPTLRHHLEMAQQLAAEKLISIRE